MITGECDREHNGALKYFFKLFKKSVILTYLLASQTRRKTSGLNKTSMKYSRQFISSAIVSIEASAAILYTGQ